MGTRLDMLGIFVQDLHTMVAFYRDALEFEIAWDGNGPYAEFRHEGTRFSMYERSQLADLLGQAPSYPDGLNGTFELAIDLPISADVDREFERLVQAGARPIHAPRDEPWGMRSSMIADPEGNLIELGSWNRGAIPVFEDPGAGRPGRIPPPASGTTARQRSSLLGGSDTVRRLKSSFGGLRASATSSGDGSPRKIGLRLCRASA